MKRVLIAVLLFALGTAAGYLGRLEQERRANAAMQTARTPDPTGGPHYRHRVSHFESLGVDRAVVMLGDSLVSNAEWSELLGTPVANRGVANDTTLGVLGRLDRSVGLRTRRVFLMVGINDLARYRNAPETVAANTRRIVERLKGRQVFVHSVLGGRTRQLKRDTARLNSLNRAYCETGACIYIDLAPVLAPDGMLGPEQSFDGRHLRGEAYRAWADRIGPLARSAGSPS